MLHSQFLFSICGHLFASDCKCYFKLHGHFCFWGGRIVGDPPKKGWADFGQLWDALLVCLLTRVGGRYMKGSAVAAWRAL